MLTNTRPRKKKKGKSKSVLCAHVSSHCRDCVRNGIKRRFIRAPCAPQRQFPIKIFFSRKRIHISAPEGRKAAHTCSQVPQSRQLRVFLDTHTSGRKDFPGNRVRPTGERRRRKTRRRRRKPITRICPLSLPSSPAHSAVSDGGIDKPENAIATPHTKIAATDVDTSSVYLPVFLYGSF